MRGSNPYITDIQYIILTNDRRDEMLAKNYYRNFKLRHPHPDTIDDVVRVLSTCQPEELKAHLVSKLFGQKLLRKFRFTCLKLSE